MENNIINLLEKDAEKRPAQTAVADMHHSVTYEKLWENVQNIACALLAESNGKWHNMPIAVRIMKTLNQLSFF